MKHTLNVKEFNGSNNELAENVGDLYYDSLAEFLESLATKIKNDGDADFNRGRKKLAHELYNCAEHLSKASDHISEAWGICSPYVDKWLAEKGYKERV